MKVKVPNYMLSCIKLISPGHHDLQNVTTSKCNVPHQSEIEKQDRETRTCCFYFFIQQPVNYSFSIILQLSFKGI